jgi:hypothetical protein
MLGLLINLLIFCIIIGLVYWVLQQHPLPEPFGRIVMVVFVVIACLVLISFLLDVGPIGHWKPITIN